MTVFFAVLVIVMIGAGFVLALGRSEPMSEEYDDRPDVRIPADRPLVGADLRRVRFTTAWRGYDAAEVDALLDRMARQLDQTD